ncbi:hypothetical protein [Gordonibacter sp. RACS_AR68]|uniref:phage baseplate protein n=1 Tax=Gordonibacter sp. RACS_AR68 TaxID=2872005 RepID=UPI00261E2B50|nr:hypothetical protein [Gordonibacter sp. RACS_AR68]MDN4470961.1 hypothetical protein [Gordonibacter sp. RACS_AR68]
MDVYEIAKLFASYRDNGSLRIRFGSVESVEQDTLMVVPDGERKSIPTVRCCHPTVGNRVILLVSGIEWLAVATIGRECCYEVGDVWVTFSNDDPHDRWPGTAWEQVRDRMLLSSGSLAAGTTGGSQTHAHWQTLGKGAGETTLYITDGSMATGSRVLHTSGGGVSTDGTWTDGISRQDRTYEESSMPPYLVVHMWKRIA